MHRLAKLVSGAVLAIAAVAVGPAAQAEEFPCGSLNAIGIVTVSSIPTTASFAPIATYDMTSFFADCVHVQFTAQFRSRTPKSVLLRATVNGMPAGFPNVVSVSTSANAFDERSVTFIIPSAALNAQIGIQIRSGDGTPVNVRNGLLRVQHNNLM